MLPLDVRMQLEEHDVTLHRRLCRLVNFDRQNESTVDSGQYSNKELTVATRTLEKNIATEHFSGHGGLRIGTRYFASPIAGGAAAILRTRSSCDRCCI